MRLSSSKQRQRQQQVQQQPRVLTALLTGLHPCRDFILKGSVVELAVAVVLGTAFTSLIEAITADWITPLSASRCMQ